MIDDFASLCTVRSAEALVGGGHSYVAANGAVIEQSQILTTHNLAQLTHALELRGRLGNLSGELAGRCFSWILSAYARPQPTWHAHLINVKKIAYALRQALFFCSLADQGAAGGAIDTWAAAIEENSHLHQLRPVAAGVKHAAEGDHFDDGGSAPEGHGRRLLGWSIGPHWLVPISAPSNAHA